MNVAVPPSVTGPCQATDTVAASSSVMVACAVPVPIVTPSGKFDSVRVTVNASSPSARLSYSVDTVSVCDSDSSGSNVNAVDVTAV